MSRFGDYDGDGEDYANGGDLWTARARMALEGKRGRAALADLRDALLALPEKRLISRALCTVDMDTRVTTELERTYPIESWMNGPTRGETVEERLARRQAYIHHDRQELVELAAEQGSGVCAIGAYVWWQKVKGGMAPDEAFAALPTIADVEGSGDYDTAEAGQQAGLTWTLAWQLAYRNDEAWEALTPEHRYVEFLAWIEQQLAKPPLRRAPRRERRQRQAGASPARPRSDTVELGL